MGCVQIWKPRLGGKGAEAGFMSESVRESVIAGQKEVNVDTGVTGRGR